MASYSSPQPPTRAALSGGIRAGRARRCVCRSSAASRPPPELALARSICQDLCFTAGHPARLIAGQHKAATVEDKRSSQWQELLRAGFLGLLELSAQDMS